MPKQPTLKQLNQRAGRAEEAVRGARANLAKAVIDRLRGVGNTRHKAVLDGLGFRLKLSELRNLASGEYGLLLTQDPYFGGLRRDKHLVEVKKFDAAARSRFLRDPAVGAVELLTVNGRRRLLCDRCKAEFAVLRAITESRINRG